MSKRSKARRKEQVRGARCEVRGNAAPPTPNTRHLEPALSASAPALFSSQATDGFRRISSMTSIRDLMPPAQDRMQAVSFYLQASNPHARRIVQTTKDFIVGEGISIECDDEAVQEQVDAFWSDPVNRMDLRLHQYVADLCTFGELVLYAARNPINGAVRLGYIDPANIESVEWGTLQGLEGIAVAQPIAVVLRQQFGATAGKRLTIVHKDEDPYSDTFGNLVGDCFYWSINAAGAATRGISDLFALADWIDGYDQMLFAVMRQVDSLSRFVWDVTIQGADDKQIDEFQRKYGAAPKANSVRFHNERVTWAAVAPALNASDKAEAVRLIKLMILGGAGFPEHWFSDGANANRATALEQGEPTLKMLTSRQLYVCGGLTEIVEYVIGSRIQAGVLPAGVDHTFTVQTPDLSVRDQGKAAAALQSVVQAMVQAQQIHAVDRETVTKLICLLAQPLGLDIDAQAVIDAALVEQEEAALQDYTRNPAAPDFAGAPGGAGNGAGGAR